MTASFMLHDERPGVGLPIKLQEQHKVCFPAGHLLDEAAGRRLAAWASGGVSPTPHGGNQAPEAREQPRDEERLGLIAEIKRLARSVPAGGKAQAAPAYLGAGAGRWGGRGGGGQGGGGAQISRGGGAGEGPNRGGGNISVPGDLGA